MLRSKISHNEISPKNKRTSQAQKENLRLSPKEISTDDPWEEGPEDPEAQERKNHPRKKTTAKKI